MRKTKLLIFTVCILLICSLLLTLCACHLDKPDDTNDDSDGQGTDIFEVEQNAIDMQVCLTSDKININLTTKENDKQGKVDILAVKAYEYFETDSYNGLSTNKILSSDSTKKIGEYNLGESKTITIERFENEYDRIYDKFYAIQDSTIIKGPIYATEIEAINDVKPDFDIKSKKGVFNDDINYLKDLNCSYTTININFEELIYPNEMYEDGTKIELSVPEDAYSFISNGKTYYFNKARVDGFDNQIKSLYDEKLHITAIILAKNVNIRPENFPQNMTYLPYSTQGTALLSINTANSSGFEYYIALMEFLASRYSDTSFEHGYIANYVIGNEVDYAQDYFKISDKLENINIYMEEYSRLMRLSNLAVKKYNANVAVNMPLTQAWTQVGLEGMDYYAPKLMVDWLNKKTKLEGDYDWGLAPHCYAYGLANSAAYLMDTIHGRKVGMTNDIETTSKLTFSNIELLGEYLNREDMKINGNARGVWLTESGISSTLDSEEERNNQAGHIASIWYKISQLDFIKAFSYYRLVDNVGEAGGVGRFGLVDVNGFKKPSYNLFKYIDTQYSEFVAKDFLKYVSYVNSAEQHLTYENGGIKSYMDLLDVFETNWFNGDFDWSKATPVTADTVYEYEDKIDLSSIRFDNKNFLFDGTEKRLEIIGELPEGVSVEYDKEPVLTQKGQKDILATFKKDGEIVGRRKATISIGDMSTNKSVYNYGEKIFVTSNIKDMNINRDAWIGLFRKGVTPGEIDKGESSYSIYFYYPNQYADSYSRTKCLQEYINPSLTNPIRTLPAGEYVLYYFDGINGSYSSFYDIAITVLPENETTNTIDLSGVKFEDKTFENDGQIKKIEIIGELPEDVKVEYINNSNSATGVYQCTAIFKYNDLEIERRYAVMTISDVVEVQIRTNKTEYLVGEDVFVTAYAPENSEQQSWWVGLYLEGENDYNTITSIYWYYVKDAKHISGIAYNLKTDTEFNTPRADYKDLPAAKYKLVLFNTSGYSVETEIYFEVKSNDTESVTEQVIPDNTQLALNENINKQITITDKAQKFSNISVK